MKIFAGRRRAKTGVDSGVAGPARVGARTKRLTGRLRPGDIAVIDHADLDRLAAEELAATRPAAVLNAARSASSAFPNLGPEILVNAGIPLVDGLGEAVMTIPEGREVVVDLTTGEVRQGGALVATGQPQGATSVAEAQAAAREGLSEQIAAFAANTMAYLEQEAAQFLDRQAVPDVRTEMDGCTVLIVVRGYHYREDLDVLRPFVRESRPVIIGVDGGADAVVEAGLKPTLIVGDMDSVSDAALRCGAELVVHAYPDGRAPGAERLDRLGLEYRVVPMVGTSEDVAMLIADDKGAALIVAVGTHLTLLEFLDKGRAGMASTFLTRLRVGAKLVDAKGVSRLYRRGVSNWQLAALLLAGMVALGAAVGSTASGQTQLGLIGAVFDDLWAWLKGVWN
ncbi:MAG: thiamine pyrophosphokinase [Bifidobacteriaceae bacterium]|jgi:uncharacterized membrane-anchored protein|nr:thiamine pyrophosphokinase [Bifidobacteriaceae bacterium]